MTKDEQAIAYPREVPDFTPVPRKSRKQDGWNVARQRGFIAALAETGSVRRAATAVGMSYVSAYRLRKAQGAESFAEAWDAAVSTGVSQVYDVLIDHSINGVPEPVFHGGQAVGERRKFDHITMRWLVERRGAGALQRTNEAREGEAADRAAWAEHIELLEAEGKHDEAAWAREERPMRGFALKLKLLRKIQEITDRQLLRDVAPYPEMRAAWELLNGPKDWDALERGESEPILRY